MILFFLFYINLFSLSHWIWSNLGCFVLFCFFDLVKVMEFIFFFCCCLIAFYLIVFSRMTTDCQINDNYDNEKKCLNQFERRKKSCQHFKVNFSYFLLFLYPNWLVLISVCLYAAKNNLFYYSQFIVIFFVTCSKNFRYFLIATFEVADLFSNSKIVIV